MGYIVKETKIWIVKDCKDEEEAESRVMYNLRAVLDDRIIEVMENHIGKWVAFRQEGMESILHGKVIKQKENLLTIKCKNGCKRWVMSKDIIGFYDDKQECYAIR